jgi:hypothetical protein
MKLSTETCESILNWLIQRSLDEDFQAAIETGGNYGSNFQELCASSNIFRDIDLSSQVIRDREARLIRGIQDIPNLGFLPLL